MRRVEERRSSVPRGLAGGAMPLLEGPTRRHDQGCPPARLLVPMLALLMVLPLPLRGQAILNVERLQRADVSGAHGEMAARFGLKSGNTDVLQLGGDLGAGLLTHRHWIRFFAGGGRSLDGGGVLSA
jgi:hypothetical protein